MPSPVPMSSPLRFWRRIARSTGARVPSRLPVAFAASVLGTGLFLVPTLAGAQTVTLGSSVIRVTSEDKEDTSTRPSSTAQTITRADCEANQGFQFQVSTTGYTSSYALEAWAGRSSVDCKLSGNRTPTNGAVQKCWKIYDGSLPRTTPQTVNLRVRDIMANDVTAGQDYVNAAKDTTVCGKGIDDTFKVSFLILPVTTNPDAVAADETFAKRVDTLGPDKVTGVAASAGEGRLLVTWGAVTSGSELYGYNLYCADANSTIPIGTTDGGTDDAAVSDAAVADASVQDASVGADASVQDASTTDGGTCGPNAALVEGAVPASPLPEGVWLCGSVNSATATGASATTGRDGKALKNGDKVWVAVAAVDQALNIGPLSAAVCGTPQPVDDFYEVYVADGGTAGCSMHGPAGGIGVGLGSGIAAFALLRRRLARRGGGR
jgi:hypothetical protein